MGKLNYRIPNTNDFKEIYVKVTDTLPIGAVCQYAGSTAPSGYLMCNGQAVSRTTYADLFNKIGTSFGAGDGVTTFNLPNFNGRVAVGLDGTQTEFDTLGETGGSKYLQEHSHTITSYWGSGAITQGEHPVYSSTGAGLGVVGTENEGTGDSGNLQPYIVTNFIIKASKKVALERGNVVDSLDGSDTDSAPSVRAVNEELSNINDRFVIATNTTYDASHGNITITGGHTLNSGALYVDANNNENTFDLYGRIIINITSNAAGTITLSDTGLRPTSAKTFYVGISQNSDTNTIWNVTATLNTDGTITIPVLNLGQTTGTRNIIISNSIHFID